jgi:hypothetical protein
MKDDRMSKSSVPFILSHRKPIAVSSEDLVTIDMFDSTHDLPLVKGDIVIIDNMLTVRACEPYVGPQRILFAIPESYTPTNMIGINREVHLILAL